MEKSKSWNFLFGFGVVIFVFGIGLAGVLTWRHIRATETPPVPETSLQRVSETEELVRPVYAKAAWVPVDRVAQRAAVMPNFQKESAQNFIEQGFSELFLPADLLDVAEDDLASPFEMLRFLGELGVRRTLRFRVGEEFEQLFTAFVEKSSFDAVCLTGISEEGSELPAFFDRFSKILEETALTIPIVIELPIDLENNGNSLLLQLRELVTSGVKLGLLIRCSPVAPLKLEGFPEFFGEEDAPEISLIWDIKDFLPNGSPEEISGLFSRISEHKSLPSVFDSLDFSPKNQDALTFLREYFLGNLDLSSVLGGLSFSSPMKTLKKSQKLETKSPDISFIGTSNPLYSLLCNGKAVKRNESGDFSFNDLLKPGDNIYQFKHMGETVEIKIFYRVQVLERVEPRGIYETSGGIELSVAALALRGAEVQAVFFGKTVNLKQGISGEEDPESIRHEEDSSFVRYTGTILLPESGTKKENIGKIKFSARYSGSTDVLEGAEVVILPEITKIIQEPRVEITTEPTSSSETQEEIFSDFSTENTTTSPETTSFMEKILKTPYEDHGFGQTKMAEITGKFVNSRQNQQSDDNSVPTSSPLLTGIFDYVTGQSGDYTLLASGKRVKTSELKMIEAGFQLPLNQILANGKEEKGNLTLRIDLDWKIPFNVNMTGQNYSKTYAYGGHSWGVSEFNASGLDITFFHTKQFGGQIDCEGTLISSAQWEKNLAANTVTLHLNLKNIGHFYGWQAIFEGNSLVIRLRPQPPKGLQGAVIVIDPGHGGKDPGSALLASHESITQEKYVNLLIALKIKSKLEAAGATVLMTRESDVYVSPADRALFARQNLPNLFLSCHADSTISAVASGTSAFYFRAFSQYLAKTVHQRVVDVWREKIYAPGKGIENEVEMREKADRGVFYYPFEVTRVEECPAILVEYGFGSNLTECRQLQKDQNQELLAQATVDGIADYLALQ